MGGMAATLRVGWLPLLIFFLMQTFGIFVGSSLAPLAPFLVADLGLTRSNIGLFTAFLYIGALVTGLPAGWLADRWGVRLPLMLSGVLTGLFLGAIAGVDVYWLMLLLVFVGGLCYGLINPVTSRGIVDWFEVSSRGTAMAIKQTGFTFGSMMAGGILPGIALFYSWRVSVAIAGMILIIWSLFSYVIYHDLPREEKDDQNREAKINLINPEVLRNYGVLSIGIYGIFLAAVQHVGMTYLVLYLVEAFSFSKVAAGGLLVLMQGGGSSGRLFWGWVSDVYFPGRRKMVLVLVGFAGAFITIILGLLQGNVSPVILATIAFFFGFTVVGQSAVYLTLVSEVVSKEVAGAAMGLSTAIAYLGIFFGPPFFGMIVDFSNSYEKAWVSFGLSLALASIIFSQIKLKLSTK